MNHHVDCQFGARAIDHYKSPSILVKNHTKRLLITKISDPLKEVAEYNTVINTVTSDRPLLPW